MFVVSIIYAGSTQLMLFSCNHENKDHPVLKRYCRASYSPKPYQLGLVPKPMQSRYMCLSGLQHQATYSNMVVQVNILLMFNKYAAMQLWFVQPSSNLLYESRINFFITLYMQTE